MSKAIFVCYRRGDSAGYTGWLCEKLLQRWSRDQIFLDVHGIGLGDNFRDKISAAVQSCDALLPVIGRDWLTITDERGNVRLGRSNDFVTIEIAAALERGIPIFPILVDGAAMPDESELPPPLKALATRLAVNLRHDSFNRDTEALFEAVAKIVPPEEDMDVKNDKRGTQRQNPRKRSRKAPSNSPIGPAPRGRWLSLEQLEESLPPRTIKNDPQKGRFGGKNEVNGRKLFASVRATHQDWCAVTLIVRTVGTTAPLRGASALFFLHNTFKPDVLEVPIDEQDMAVLQVLAWGAFTVGVVVDDGATLLELDLSNSALVEAPTDWQAR